MTPGNRCTQNITLLKITSRSINDIGLSPKEGKKILEVLNKLRTYRTLTPQQLSERAAQFALIRRALFDPNVVAMRDGLIRPGVAHPVRDVWRRADADRNARLDFDEFPEFIAGMSRMRRPGSHVPRIKIPAVSGESLLLVFRKVDEGDNDGLISYKEFIDCLTDVQKQYLQSPEYQAELTAARGKIRAGEEGEKAAAAHRSQHAAYASKIDALLARSRTAARDESDATSGKASIAAAVTSTTNPSRKTGTVARLNTGAQNAQSPVDITQVLKKSGRKPEMDLQLTPMKEVYPDLQVSEKQTILPARMRHML